MGGPLAILSNTILSFNHKWCLFKIGIILDL